MHHSNKLKIILIICVICIPVIACRGGETPVASEDVVSAVPSDSSSPITTSEPVQTHGTPVTDINQIVGTWIASANPEIFYLLIQPDGTVKYAPSLFDLERGSTNTWIFRVEEEKIVAEEFDLCPDDIGSYFGVIQDDGNLKLTSIIDPCPNRLRHLDHSLPGRLYEYNLVYSPVE